MEPITRIGKGTTHGELKKTAAAIIFFNAFFTAIDRRATRQDEYVQTLIKNSSVPVAIFYFLNSVVYGLWAVLEAQMRPGIPSFGPSQCRPLPRKSMVLRARRGRGRD